jgi:hypothetical protein
MSSWKVGPWKIYFWKLVTQFVGLISSTYQTSYGWSNKEINEFGILVLDVYQDTRERAWVCGCEKLDNGPYCGIWSFVILNCSWVPRCLVMEPLWTSFHLADCLGATWTSTYVSKCPTYKYTLCAYMTFYVVFYMFNIYDSSVFY